MDELWTKVLLIAASERLITFHQWKSQILKETTKTNSKASIDRLIDFFSVWDIEASLLLFKSLGFNHSFELASFSPICRSLFRWICPQFHCQTLSVRVFTKYIFFQSWALPGLLSWSGYAKTNKLLDLVISRCSRTPSCSRYPVMFFPMGGRGQPQQGASSNNTHRSNSNHNAKVH